MEHGQSLLSKVRAHPRVLSVVPAGATPSPSDPKSRAALSGRSLLGRSRPPTPSWARPFALPCRLWTGPPCTGCPHPHCRCRWRSMRSPDAKRPDQPKSIRAPSPVNLGGSAERNNANSLDPPMPTSLSHLSIPCQGKSAERRLDLVALAADSAVLVAIQSIQPFPTAMAQPRDDVVGGIAPSLQHRMAGPANSLVAHESAQTANPPTISVRSRMMLRSSILGHPSASEGRPRELVRRVCRTRRPVECRRLPGPATTHARILSRGVFPTGVRSSYLTSPPVAVTTSRATRIVTHSPAKMFLMVPSAMPERAAKALPLSSLTSR